MSLYVLDHEQSLSFSRHCFLVEVNIGQKTFMAYLCIILFIYLFIVQIQIPLMSSWVAFVLLYGLYISVLKMLVDWCDTFTPSL